MTFKVLLKKNLFMSGILRATQDRLKQAGTIDNIYVTLQTQSGNVSRFQKLLEYHFDYYGWNLIC